MIDYVNEMALVRLRGYIRQLGIRAEFSKDKAAVEFTRNGTTYRVTTWPDAAVVLRSISPTGSLMHYLGK